MKILIVHNRYQIPGGEDQVAAQEAELLREKRRQQTVVALRQRYGKNVILRGSNFLDGATMRERNGQIGGHKA